MDITTVLNNINIDQQLATLLLMLPVVATIAGIARYVFGIKSLGLYAPIVLTFSFYALGLNGKYGQYSDVVAGLRNGVLAVLVVVIFSYLGSIFTRSAKLHYFPKISMTLSIVSLGLLVFVALFEAVTGYGKITSGNVLALILIVSIAEQFISTSNKKNFKTSLLTTLETLVISAFSYALIAWIDFQMVVLTYPYVILLTLPINYWVGKYRGLRVREFYRFRSILNSEPLDN